MLQKYIYFFFVIFHSSLTHGQRRYVKSSIQPNIIDLRGVKNTASLVKILNGLQNYDAENEYKSRGKQLAGVDVEYRSTSQEEKTDDYRSKVMQLLQKNYNAGYDDQTRTKASSSRVYFISNPEVLEKYGKKKTSSSSSSAEDEFNLNNFFRNVGRRSLEQDETTNTPNASIEDLPTLKPSTNDNDNMSPFPIPFEQHEEIQQRGDDQRNSFENDNFSRRNSWDEDRSEVQSKPKDEERWDNRPVKVTRGDVAVRKEMDKESWQKKRGRESNWQKNSFEEERPKPAARPRKAVERPRRPVMRPKMPAARQRDDRFNANPPAMSYGRTPVPYRGKKGIYADDKK